MQVVVLTEIQMMALKDASEGTDWDTRVVDKRYNSSPKNIVSMQ